MQKIGASHLTLGIAKGVIIKIKMRPFIILFVFVAFISSCNQENIPKNVLDKNKMGAILCELHKAEAYVNSNFQYNDTSKFVYKKLEDSILTANGTQIVAFDSSMAFYRRNIKLLDEIYAEAIDSLSLKESLGK